MVAFYGLWQKEYKLGEKHIKVSCQVHCILTKENDDTGYPPETIHAVSWWEEAENPWVSLFLAGS